MDYKLHMLEQEENEKYYDYVYRVLRYNIMTLNLKPGMAIKEKELTEIFNISRTPIREATMQLENENLIDVVSQSGSTVTYINISLARQGLFLRTSVEPLVLYKAAGTLNREAILKLQDLISGQKENLNNPNFDYYKSDDDFHRTIYEASGFGHVWKAIKYASAHIDRIRYMGTIAFPKNVEKFTGEHDSIFNELVFGNNLPLSYWENIVAEHIGQFKSVFNELKEIYSGYFIL